MHTLQEKALNNALKTLDHLGCKYRVVLPDGSEQFTLPEEDMKPRRERAHNVPHGGLREAARKLLEGMLPGHIREISIDDFEHDVPFEVFVKAISNTGFAMFGTGAFVIESDRTKENGGRKIVTAYRAC